MQHFKLLCMQLMLTSQKAVLLHEIPYDRFLYGNVIPNESGMQNEHTSNVINEFFESCQGGDIWEAGIFHGTVAPSLVVSRLLFILFYCFGRCGLSSKKVKISRHPRCSVYTHQLAHHLPLLGKQVSLSLKFKQERGGGIIECCKNICLNVSNELSLL